MSWDAAGAAGAGRGPTVADGGHVYATFQAPSGAAVRWAGPWQGSVAAAGRMIAVSGQKVWLDRRS
ncbi:hypothetical protein Cme02nite_44630 [Catellatospora methionotrophica]|uniref:Uncharacterized protein n=1 Tax=Catellatospora methionotrophica TaxID=121620 RepID=A0A8J3LJ51_9ACTN|nr:hypothetical protein Cme02nite_44630 [Catellatospora methionotrophica]